MFLRFLTNKTLKNECSPTSSHHQPCAIMPSSLMLGMTNVSTVLPVQFSVTGIQQVTIFFLCHYVMNVLKSIRMCCVVHTRYNDEYLITSCQDYQHFTKEMGCPEFCCSSHFPLQIISSSCLDSLCRFSVTAAFCSSFSFHITFNSWCILLSIGIAMVIRLSS